MRDVKPDAPRQLDGHVIRLSIGDAVLGRAEGRDRSTALAAARRLARFADKPDVAFAERDPKTGEFLPLPPEAVLDAGHGSQDDAAASETADAGESEAEAAERRAAEQAKLAALLPGGGPAASEES
jgi:hypothetical protein